MKEEEIVEEEEGKTEEELNQLLQKKRLESLALHATRRKLDNTDKELYRKMRNVWRNELNIVYRIRTT